MDDNEAPTFSAFTMRRIGKRRLVWLEVGTGRLDDDGIFHGFLDRLPIGGFSGYVRFSPVGQVPPEPEPLRPDDTGEGDEG